jgi:hypothetical protein
MKLRHVSTLVIMLGVTLFVVEPAMARRPPALPMRQGQAPPPPPPDERPDDHFAPPRRDFDPPPDHRRDRDDDFDVAMN